MVQAPRLSLVFILLVLGFFLLVERAALQSQKKSISYSELLSALDQGRVSEVQIGAKSISGTWKAPSSAEGLGFEAVKIDDPGLVDRLTQAGVQFQGTQEVDFLGHFFFWVGVGLFLSLLWTLFFRVKGDAFRSTGSLLSLSKSKAKIYLQTDLKTRFADVAGVDEAKEDLQEVVNFLKNPTQYSQLGCRMPKGILLLGPPGTGKTLLARAVAGEAGVPFFSINGSEFVELFVGLGATRVRDLFFEARQKTPCIVFIDELDALGKARGLLSVSGSGNDEKEQTLNQLLAEMDGFDPSSGIILLAATNRPEVLDPALLRAGRFDRQIVVDKPDRVGREKILQIHLKGIRLSPHVDIPALASITVGFSGADLANLANEAALIATRRGAQEVTSDDFTQAVERLVVGLQRKSRILSPEEKKRVAYHEMGHAMVSFALGRGEVVHKVSIIPRGLSAIGTTIRRPLEDRILFTREELEAKIAIALGGRASEQVFLSEVSTGAADDLDRATEMARAMVTQYGMDPQLGLAVYERESAPTLRVSGALTHSFAYSEATAQRIDDSISQVLNQSYRRAKEVMLKYPELIQEGVQTLLTQETLEERQLKDLWSKRTEIRSCPFRETTGAADRS
ncbi:MAG: ATP-dependent zinc metalloprotease FtsH, partial [Bdellovibrionia bacterium]